MKTESEEEKQGRIAGPVAACDWRTGASRRKKVRSKESQGGHFSEQGGHSDNWHGKIKYIFIKCQIADEMGPIH